MIKMYHTKTSRSASGYFATKVQLINEYEACVIQIIVHEDPAFGTKW